MAVAGFFDPGSLEVVSKPQIRFKGPAAAGLHV